MDRQTDRQIAYLENPNMFFISHLMAVSSFLIPFHLYWYFCSAANNLIPDLNFYICCFLSQICSCNSFLCTSPPKNKKTTLLTPIYHLAFLPNAISLEKTFLNTKFKLVFPTPSTGTFSFSIFLHSIFYNFRLHWNCNKCNFFICTFLLPATSLNNIISFLCLSFLKYLHCFFNLKQ